MLILTLTVPRIYSNLSFFKQKDKKKKELKKTVSICKEHNTPMQLVWTDLFGYSILLNDPKRL